METVFSVCCRRLLQKTGARTPYSSPLLLMRCWSIEPDGLPRLDARLVAVLCLVYYCCLFMYLCLLFSCLLCLFYLVSPCSMLVYCKRGRGPLLSLVGTVDNTGSHNTGSKSYVLKLVERNSSLFEPVLSEPVLSIVPLIHATGFMSSGICSGTPEPSLQL